MTNVTELTGNEFDNFTKSGLVLVDFFADWCMPCVMMSPIIEDLADEFKGKIKFAKVDIEENVKLAGKFNVMSIPNFVLFKDGEILDRFVGSRPMEDFEERLKKHL